MRSITCPACRLSSDKSSALPSVLMPICIAYAVFRLRVLDVNFVLNRALVYGVLSLGVVTMVSILDWLFSRVVAIGRLAVGFELLTAIGIGFLLDRINRSVESFVESVFFRRRRLAERYLRRAASALPYATDEAAIADGLVQVPVDAIDLAAAALYRRSAGGTRFEGIATANQTMVAPRRIRREPSAGAYAARRRKGGLARRSAHATRCRKCGDLHAGDARDRAPRARFLYAIMARTRTARNSTPTKWPCWKNLRSKPRERTTMWRPYAYANGTRSLLRRFWASFVQGVSREETSCRRTAALSGYRTTAVGRYS